MVVLNVWMSQTTLAWLLSSVFENPWKLVDCAEITGTQVGLLTCAVSHSYSKSASTGISCTYSVFTYAFNSFVTQTVESRYMLNPACARMTWLTLPFISLSIFIFFFLSLLLSCPLLLTFSPSPLGEQQRKSGRPAVCLTFEVGLLCLARPATCWLCVRACVVCAHRGKSL